MYPTTKILTKSSKSIKCVQVIMMVIMIIINDNNDNDNNDNYENNTSDDDDDSDVNNDNNSNDNKRWCMMTVVKITITIAIKRLVWDLCTCDIHANNLRPHLSWYWWLILTQ